MKRPTNLKVGDQFRVMKEIRLFKKGEIISLKEDDGSDYPSFWSEDRSYFNSIFWSYLKPYLKTIRDVQVGDVVVEKNSGDEYLVLERGQSTVLLSKRNNFKSTGHDAIFDELEEYFTLKDAPEVEQTILTMSQIAEKFGIEVSKLKIIKE